MSAMEDWVAEVCRDLGLDLADQDATTTRVLDLTAHVAHGVARPAAPVTAFLVGLAAGASANPEETVTRLCEVLGERAKAWRDAHPE
jgi:hypothetical protein